MRNRWASTWHDASHRRTMRLHLELLKESRWIDVRISAKFAKKLGKEMTRWPHLREVMVIHRTALDVVTRRLAVLIVIPKSKLALINGNHYADLLRED